MTLRFKNVHIDKLDDKVNKYNNVYHKTSRLKLIDVTLNTYIDFNVENNDKDPRSYI